MNAFLTILVVLIFSSSARADILIDDREKIIRFARENVGLYPSEVKRPKEEMRVTVWSNVLTYGREYDDGNQRLDFPGPVPASNFTPDMRIEDKCTQRGQVRAKDRNGQVYIVPELFCVETRIVPDNEFYLSRRGCAHIHSPLSPYAIADNKGPEGEICDWTEGPVFSIKMSPTQYRKIDKSGTPFRFIFVPGDVKNKPVVEKFEFTERPTLDRLSLTHTVQYTVHGTIRHVTMFMIESNVPVKVQEFSGR